jgi:hypothetical protein
MTRYYWTGFSSGNRHAAISNFMTIINNHGAVVDTKLFSDLSISLIIEIDLNKINALYTDLSQSITLSEFEKLNSNSTKEVELLLNISFSQSTGNLQIEVPAVP